MGDHLVDGKDQRGDFECPRKCLTGDAKGVGEDEDRVSNCRVMFSASGRCEWRKAKNECIHDIRVMATLKKRPTGTEGEQGAGEPDMLGNLWSECIKCKEI